MVRLILGVGQMHKPMKFFIIPILISIFTLTGCIGTVSTRVDNKEDESWAGSYPLTAPVSNVLIIHDMWSNGLGLCSNREAGIVLSIFPIASIPIDICVDVILLPVDLVCWPLGMKKHIFNK